MGNSGAIMDLAKLEELRAGMRKAYLTNQGTKAQGDMSLGELLSCLEYELAARHAEAYECDVVESLLREMRKRVGD